jgi:hypothetical protein
MSLKRFLRIGLKLKLACIPGQSSGVGFFIEARSPKESVLTRLLPALESQKHLIPTNPPPY